MLPEELYRGITEPDSEGRPVLYRYLAPSDSLDAITAMLHEAYAPLAAAGMRFLATHQDASTTRKRIEQGETIVAVCAETVVGIVTVISPGQTDGSPFYNRRDVAKFCQFCVSPDFQRAGIGSRLLFIVECLAKAKAASHIALDTSEHALHLIDWYGARGYCLVEYCRWHDVNYRSKILAKRLS